MAESKRILVAEDDPAFAGVIRVTLEHRGWQVSVARNGQAAWELIEREKFDLLVTDYQMPHMSGEELCRRIHQSPALSGLPMILVSAKRLEFDSEQLCRQCGIRGILGKPFSPRQLVRMVETELDLCPVAGPPGKTAAAGAN